MEITAEFVAGAVWGYITRRLQENPRTYTATRAWAVLAEMAYTDPTLAASAWYTAHSSGGAGFVKEWNKVKKLVGGR